MIESDTLGTKVIATEEVHRYTSQGELAVARNSAQLWPGVYHQPRSADFKPRLKKKKKKDYSGWGLHHWCNYHSRLHT